MEQPLIQLYDSMRWLLRSQEEAVRVALERDHEWKVHSVEVGIKTEPRTLNTPTFHAFTIRVFLGRTKEAMGLSAALSDEELKANVGAALKISPDQRWSFGKSLEKPGLYQLQYTSRFQWSDWGGLS